MESTTTQPEPSGASRADAKNYRCLAGRLPKLSSYLICSLRQRDIERVRVWRNAQQRVLRQDTPIGVSEQARYFEQVVRPGFSQPRPKMILLSLLFENTCIGYTGLTNLDWSSGRAEISFLLDPERGADLEQYARDFAACLHLLSHTAFEILGLRRLFAETYDIRPRHVAGLEDHGYLLEGRLRKHVWIDGEAVDSLIHGLLESDWRAIEKASSVRDECQRASISS